MTRLRQLLLAGLVDSFGLSVGWTLVNLLAVARGGLAEAALFNAAMLAGVVLSAPATAFLARRLTRRQLLGGAAAIEAGLRLGTLAGLLAGWPAPAVAGCVVAMYVAAFTGFAAMRAEVAAVDARPRAMTRYAMCVAAVEAGGAGLASMLPIHHSASLFVISIAYSVSLLPTVLAARHASGTRPAPGRPARPNPSVLLGGAAVAVLASGPALLGVALATELHGQSWLAAAAAAYSAGCLCSSSAVDRIGRLRLPATLAWPLWGVGMLAGWVAAPWHVAGLLAAQFLSGLSLTAFEGVMDARVARDAPAGSVTTALAWTAATRALGGAAAVRALPLLVAAPAVGVVAGAGSASLAAGGLAVTVLAGALRPTGRHHHHPAVYSGRRRAGRDERRGTGGPFGGGSGAKVGALQVSAGAGLPPI